MSTRTSLGRPDVSFPVAQNGTLVMRSVVHAAGAQEGHGGTGSPDLAPPSAGVRAELEGLDMDFDPTLIRQQLAPVVTAARSQHPPSGRCRRLSFEAMRALPARAITLPPPPPAPPSEPGARLEPVASAPEPIRGMPILSVGEADVDPATKRSRLVAESIAPVSYWSESAATEANEGTPVPTSYRIPAAPWTTPAEEPPPPRKRGKTRIVVASLVWAALLAGAALVYTGVLPIGGSDSRTASAPSAPLPLRLQSSDPTPPPAAAPAVAETEATADPVEPAATASAEAPPVQPAAATSGEATAADKSAAPPKARSTKAASSPRAAQGNAKIEIASVFYGHTADDRSVTLDIDGRSVILREGDVTDDVQVETILRDGVVFRQGKRRFAVYR